MSYAEHTPWSDPGPFAARLAELPTDPRDLADALEEFLIHHAVARFLKFGVPDYAESDRGQRTVERLLRTALGRDDRTLLQHRDLPAYLYGTCHDFALLAAGVFRANGIEARLRVGFADYFRRGYWEDHWVCEYRSAGTWRRLDAQMGRREREGRGLQFDVADVPRDRFRAGGDLWLAIRRGEIDPATCGLSYAEISGDWFPASNVLKDAATLAGIEPLPWDFWGPARAFARDRAVSEQARPDVDALANALLAPPDSLEAAQSLLSDFPWAVPGDTVLSSGAGGRLEEQPLL